MPQPLDYATPRRRKLVWPYWEVWVALAVTNAPIIAWGIYRLLPER